MRNELIALYKKYEIEVNHVINQMKGIPLSLHCWQLDDVQGFEKATTLTGGIQATGNYLGKPRNFNEFKQDLDLVLKLLPGKKKINLHAIYQSDEVVDRQDI